jgi:autotransporter-associated beta strand protein
MGAVFGPSGNLILVKEYAIGCWMVYPYEGRLVGFSVRWQLALLWAAAMALPAIVLAMTITDYDPELHDRFESGFPLAPQPNPSASFIGADFDWSAVAWSTTTFEASSYKGFALLSPKHLLVAQHYEHGSQATQGVRILGQSGEVLTVADMGATVNLEQGIFLPPDKEPKAHDLAITRLGTLFPTSELTRMAVLDLHNTSGTNTNGNYHGRALLHYGRGGSTNASPRVGGTAVQSITTFDSDPKQLAILTPRTDVQLVLGDSGSPLLHPWTNPDGTKELTVLGVNSAIGSEFNFISFIGSVAAINATNEVMIEDGFALRLVGDPSNTWVGSSNTNINNRGAWGLSAPAQAPSDRYVLFNGSTAGNNRNVTVSTNHNLRGLYFKSTGSDTLGFNFSGTSTLTIGRGGITQYDISTQTFNAPLRLGDHQYWQVGAGGLVINDLDTNGNLLEIGGSGPSQFNGVVSGSGSLALSGQQLRLANTHSYTGDTWVHAGELRVNGSIASSAQLHLAADASVRGSGILPLVSGAGRVAPGLDGESPAVLTATALQPHAQMRFDFELREASPDYGNTSNSHNSVLRLTDATPFVSPLSSSNTVRLFLGVTAIAQEDAFRGGFFTDATDDFASALAAAQVELYLLDPGGVVDFNGETYSLYVDSLAYVLRTDAESADFASGTVAGRVMILEITPDPATYAGWIYFNFPYDAPEADTGLLADPSGDGIVNLLAYALALDPLISNQQSVPRLHEHTPGNFEFHYRRNKLAIDLTYTVEASTDLIQWDSLTIEPAVVDPNPDGDGSSELLAVDLSTAISEGFSFFRLRVDID